MSNIFESLRRAQPRFPGVDPGLFASEGAPGKLDPREPGTSSVPLAAHESPTRELRIQEFSPLFPFDGTDPRAGEEYRILRTKIVQHQRQPRCIVISSAGVGDGKSTTAINLSAAFALKTDEQILLIEGDFRRTKVAAQLGLPNERGLAEALAGKCTLESVIVQAGQIPNLHILPAGKAAINPSELLDSPSWASVVLRCRQHYKYIFIDSPPVGIVADFNLIESHCDGVILIARQDHTKRAPFLELLKQIPKDKLLGVVLNSSTPWPFGKQSRPAAYYYGSYPGMESR